MSPNEDISELKDRIEVLENAILGLLMLTGDESMGDQDKAWEAAMAAVGERALAFRRIYSANRENTWEMT